MRVRIEMRVRIRILNEKADYTVGLILIPGGIVERVTFFNVVESEMTNDSSVIQRAG